MSGDSASFFLLDERIQRFLWAEGWESLRDAQEAAIPLIVKADRDVIVAAATAAGKTEAAFLPAAVAAATRSEERTSELQSQSNLVCRLLLEKKKHEHAAWPSMT